MTLTETRPEAVAVPATAGPKSLVPTRGPATWLTTADSATIGRLFIGTSMLFALGALGLGGLAAVERVAPADAFLSNAALRLLSLGIVGLAFMVVVPLWTGVAIAIVPLQVGARTVAFPRAAALSFWGWLGGAGLIIGSYAGHGGPDGTSPNSVGLFIVGLGLLAVSLVIASISVATTVLTLRVPGMYLDRVPFFAWAAMVTAIGMVLTLPVLVGALIYYYVDHRYGGGALPDGSLLQGISWSFRQPTTLLIALPVLGFAGDVTPVFARTRVAIPSAVYGAIGLCLVLGYGAWVLDVLIPSVRSDFLFQVVSVAAVLPVLMVLGMVGHTLRLGKPKFGTPLIAAVTSLLLLLGGTVISALVGIEPLNLVGTAAEQAQTDAMLLASLVAAVGALTYWAPKLWGRLLPNAATSGLVVLGFLGVGLAAGANLMLGWVGDQPAWASVFDDKRDYTGVLNVLVAAGYWLVLLMVLSFGLLLLKIVVSKSEAVADDPWEGHTLEWATTSPPPPGNFATPLEVVHSDRPVLDRREALS